MGWPKLHETERGAAVWRIFWEAGFLPRPADASFASLGGSAGGAVADSKITKVFLLRCSIVVVHVTCVRVCVGVLSLFCEWGGGELAWRLSFALFLLLRPMTKMLRALFGVV